jgi:RNA polymerase subunit RPABC4/transcription elongation factor Spt4
MSRPIFLNVGYDNDGNFIPLRYETPGIQIEHVKFEKDTGRLMVSDIRVVWHKEKSRKKEILKEALEVAAVVGTVALAGAAAGRMGRGIGRGMAGRALGGAMTGLGFGLGAGMMINAMNRNHFENRDKDGNLDSIAIPLIAIQDFQSDSKGFTLFLESGDVMSFELHDMKYLPAIKSAILSKKDEGKCPYCGTIVPPGGTSCPSCGAPVRGPPLKPSPAGAPRPSVTAQVAVQGPAVQTVKCSKCGRMVPLSRFCPVCGAPIESFCPHCGKAIPSDVTGNFCPFCGGKI